MKLNIGVGILFLNLAAQLNGSEPLVTISIINNTNTTLVLKQDGRELLLVTGRFKNGQIYAKIGAIECLTGRRKGRKYKDPVHYLLGSGVTCLEFNKVRNVLHISAIDDDSSVSASEGE